MQSFGVAVGATGVAATLEATAGGVDSLAGFAPSHHCAPDAAAVGVETLDADTTVVAAGPNVAVVVGLVFAALCLVVDPAASSFAHYAVLDFGLSAVVEAVLFVVFESSVAAERFGIAGLQSVNGVVVMALVECSGFVTRSAAASFELGD